MTTKIKNSDNKNVFSWAWNEFLFAREFEYETPLTPDEVMQALRHVETDSYYSWGHWSMIDHKVSYEPTGDKEGTFRIILEKRKVDDWFDEQNTVQEIQGTLTVDADTGMTTVKGYTRFNVKQYRIILLVSVINFWIYFNAPHLSWVLWIIIFVAASVWYNLYDERNKVADRIDDIIMNAKATYSADYLSDENTDEHVASEIYEAQSAYQTHKISEYPITSVK